MRAFLISLGLALALATAAGKPPTVPAHAASGVAPSASAASSDASLIESGTYVNSDRQRIHVPAHTVGGAAPAGASARCRDGSFSFSAHHRGTCSRHGGVASWL